jgi:DNA-binding response OmpR family regulator
MSHARILVVEDEVKISDIVKSYLDREGYEVLVASSGKVALAEINNRYDLVILDLKLPDMDGETVCGALREVSNIPVIMLTAKSSEDDRVRGLGLGADDYVIKPFSARELVARVKAQLRRSAPSGNIELSFNRGTLVIKTQFCEVRKNNKKIELTNTEYRILLGLAERPDIVLDRSRLINMAQGFDFEGFDRTVDAHIKNLRQKIESDPRKPVFIKTIYGMGYKFIGIPDR